MSYLIKDQSVVAIYDHAQPYWIILYNVLIDWARESSTVDSNPLLYLALLLQNEKVRKMFRAQSHIWERILAFSYMYPSKIFIHLLSLRGENNEFYIASLQRHKCHVFEECQHCSAPQNLLQTPYKNLIWSCFERREDACLPVSSWFSYSIFMYGFRVKTHSNTKNSQTQKNPFFGGVQTCLVLAGLHCHGKKTGLSSMVRRFWATVDSPLC